MVKILKIPLVPRFLIRLSNQRTKYYKVIPYTAHDKSLISMEQLLHLGDIENLKSHRQTLRMVNNSELQVIGSVGLHVHKSKTCALSFLVTREEIRHIVIGNATLQVLYPNMSFTTVEVSSIAKGAISRSLSTDS